MNTTNSHKTITNVPQVKSQFWSNTGSDLFDISDAITNILDSEDKEILRWRQEEFEKCFNELKNEVEIVRTTIGYNYKDYSNKLLYSDKLIDNWIDNLFIQFPNLKIKYDRVLMQATDLWITDLIKSQLFELFIEDLVYESIQPDTQDLDKSKSYDFLDYLLKFAFENQWFNPTTSFDRLRKFKLACFNLVKFNNYTNEQLEIIFDNLINLKWIDFLDNDFADLHSDQLNIIFDNLNSVRYVNFVWIEFKSIPVNSIVLIFNKISHCQYINFSQSRLAKLQIEDLETIFSALVWVKYINLYKIPFTPDKQAAIAKILVGTIITF